MSVKAGDIVIELSLDNQGFEARVKDSGEVLRKLQGDFKKTATSVQKMEERAESLGTKFRHLVITLGNLRFVAMDINDVFLRLPMNILRTAGEMERLQATMTGLSKQLTDSAKAAEGAMNFKFVTDLAKRAPFEIGAIADAFIKFKTGGLDPANGSMQALIDSVAKFGGNNESLKRASVAIQQMLGKGVVSMEELRQQLGEAVPTAMQDMADAMGVSMGKLAKTVQSGTVQASASIEKMLVRMEINNSGAAAKMMNTWVGSLSRLKTEWALTAKFISEESGFGDAAKQVLDGLSAGMGSDEFKRFAVEFGNTLKGAVEGLTAFTRVIIENRDAVMLLAEAWLLYKVGTSLIYPSLTKITEGMGRVRKEVADSARATVEAGLRDQERAQRSRQAEFLRAEAHAQAVAQKLALDQKELASVRARNAAILAADTQLAAQREMLERRAYIPGLNNQAARDAQIAAMARVSQKNSELIQREKELMAAVQAGQVAQAAANATLAQKTVALGTVAQQMAATGAAARALSVATSGLQWTFNALGGWIGLATIALVAGIEMWSRYARAAEEAAGRARRASLGLATAADVKAQQDALAALQRDLQKAQEAQASNTVAIAGRSGTARRQKTTEEALAQAAEVRRLSAEVAQAQEVLAGAQRSVMESEGRDVAAAAARNLDRRLADLARTAEVEKAAVTASYAARIGALKEGSKEHQAVINERTKAETEAYLKGRRAQLDVVTAELDRERKTWLSAAAESPSKLAAEQRVKDLEARKKELEGGIARVLGTKQGDGIIPTIAKDLEGAGPAKKSPIRELIERLEAENAGLNSQVGSLGRTLTAMDRVAAEFQEIDKKFANGDFDGKGKKGVKATAADVDALKELTRAKILQDERIKDDQNFVQQVEALQPRYAEAMEILADPLGENRRGRTLRAVDEFFRQLDERRLQALASTRGMTAAQLQEKVRGEAAMIDAAPHFQKMARDTKELQDSITQDSRDSARARQAAENELYRVFMQNEIDKARAAAGTNAELLRQVEQMQAGLDANMAARAAVMGQKFKSPMEQMVSQWENSTRNMEEATARWSEQTMDAFASAAATGKLEFKSLVQSILADWIKIEARKNFGGAVGGLIKTAIGAMTGSGGMEGLGSVNPSSGEYMGSLEFAKGGIMTRFGAVPLRKYAAGGIANSPQMALFGEGSTPEAYVPLPDGRRIPVAMEGGSSAPPVTVNVINQTGQQVNAQQGQARFDGKQMVLDVVLSAANQPGPFRDGMRTALK